MSLETATFRLLLAATLGLLIGLERETHGRYAGLRTQFIVALCSCLLMMLSLEMARQFASSGAASAVRVDPGRIASYAVAGMGFLGAGTILHGKGSIQGLTTAACLWATNAIGLAVGAGMYGPAILAAFLVVLSLIVLQHWVAHVPRDTYWRLYLDFSGCQDRVPEIREMLTRINVHVLHTGFDCQFLAGVTSYEVAVRLKSSMDMTEAVQSLRCMEGLTRIRWTEGYVP